MKKLKKDEVSLIAKDKVIVDFFAEWCGPCMYMKPFFESAESDINALGITCYQVDVDECEDFSIKNKIQFVPCVILFENGKEIDRFTGGRDKDGIMDFVRKNTKK